MTAIYLIFTLHAYLLRYYRKKINPIMKVKKQISEFIIQNFLKIICQKRDLKGSFKIKNKNIDPFKDFLVYFPIINQLSLP